jgi:hypothetical protein
MSAAVSLTTPQLGVAWVETTRTLTSAAVEAAAVWGYTTRNLTSGIASTWGASDVWGYATRTLTSAAAIWTETTRVVTGVPVSTWGPTDVWAAAARTLTSGAAMWSGAVDGTLTYDQAMKGLVAANLGNSTGGGTTAIAFRNFGSTVDRLNYTVTTLGNRSLSTYSW